MNPMQNKTPEERKASRVKGAATYRANKAAREAKRQADLDRVDSLKIKIKALEAKLAGLERFELMSTMSATLTGKSLLREDEIADAAMPLKNDCGVYFLLKGRQVVYVGQSVSIYSRIGSHTDKEFDRYAYIPCERDMLDKLESLYIHCLRPPLNGEMSNGLKLAPIALDELIG